MCLTLSTFIVPQFLFAQASKASDSEKGFPDIPNKDVEIGEVYQTDAKKESKRFVSAIKKDIRRLYVLIQNYSALVPGSEQQFGKIKTDYKDALIRYYKKQFTWALYIHKKNMKEIQDLYKKFALQYKEKVLKLLAEGSEKIVDAEVKQIEVRGQKGRKFVEGQPYRENSINSNRLRLAFQQNGIGEEMYQKGFYQKAIDHYRLSILYSIRILENLAEEKKLKDEIKSKYRKEKLDSRGLIASKAN